MISIKDYAKENGISYEAVRQQIARYSKELEGHIHKDGRTRFLDDEAVTFLQGHRLKEPVTIFQGSPDTARIEFLESEIERLKSEKEDLRKALDAAKDKIIEMYEENKKISLSIAKNELLQAENEKQDKLLEETRNKLNLADSELQKARSLIEKYENLPIIGKFIKNKHPENL